MVGKWWIGRDWEGSSHGVTEVLYCNLPYMTEKNNEEKSRKSIPSQTWNGHLLNTTCSVYLHHKMNLYNFIWFWTFQFDGTLDAYIIHKLVASVSSAGNLAQKWLWHVAMPVYNSCQWPWDELFLSFKRGFHVRCWHTQKTSSTCSLGNYKHV